MPLADLARNPRLAYALDDGGRGYLFGDPTEFFYSVTTIINGGVPKHLQKHYAKMTAELALEAFDLPARRASAMLRRWARLGRASVEERQERGELKSIKLSRLSDRDLAARWLKEAADRHRDAAADRGSAVHHLAEDLVLDLARESGRLLWAGKDLPAWDQALEPWMRSFKAFLDEQDPEYLAAEATVFNRPEAYAGTLDAIVRLPSAEEQIGWLEPRPRVLDIKTGGEIYAEVAQQLSAYARGQFIGHPENRRIEISMPEGLDTDLGWCLHLRPAKQLADGTWEADYRLIPVDIGPAVFDAFRYARENYRWINDTSRRVLGKPVPRPGHEEAA